MVLWVPSIAVRGGTRPAVGTSPRLTDEEQGNAVL